MGIEAIGSGVGNAYIVSGVCLRVVWPVIRRQATDATAATPDRAPLQSRRTAHGVADTHLTMLDRCIRKHSL
ncbi:hypothetical protein C6Q22_19280 [Burkholderia multivorans]|uniref:Uncharacterized protein n=2 Tax=Burkholderia multivorans TaxID=87883 RepID=B9BS98_9BURK|nr:hypothetical protein BURMUCGD2_4266 [Burkholderia multivorans CGD2]EEE12290.1 hypothetical protein BURMUCGD2M_4255 [Burkholderia multivorans CGD2M]PRD85894.1 hypothetical protein C6P76_16015 [Burkholderia multivorans]PRE17548.1 hypothetical protein C6P92_13125 [Burkholderia multivorans]PRE27063.1 hypothetical protein C6P79_16225 [Burkholderia multivorans]